MIQTSARNARDFTKPPTMPEPDLPGTTAHNLKWTQKGTPGEAAGDGRAVPPIGIDSPTIGQVEVPQLSTSVDHHT